MAKKAIGRPKGKAATENLKDQNDAKIDQSTDQLKEGNAEDIVHKEEVNEFEDIKDQNNVSASNEKTSEAEKAKGEEKVIEVKVSTQKPAKLRPSQQRKRTHTVFVKGRPREMSREAYEAVSRDPALNVTLPKGSRLAEPMLDKPCEDC